MCDTAPVLLVLFNRPDLGERVMERVRGASPSRLFIAVDGARRERHGEEALVKKTRELASIVDWPCHVSTLFRDSNLGCGRAVSEAISWFFESVESGIILEDDCVPDPSFFPFASELLERYANEERVMMINGTSYIPEELNRDRSESYYFSMFGNIWGWASWRRAWMRYDYGLAGWPGNRLAQERLRKLGLLPKWHLNRNFELSKKGIIDTWDYQWEHSIHAHDGVAIAPFNNLVSNIGFDGRATHTSKGDDGRAERTCSPVEFPLVHQEGLSVDDGLDRWYCDEYIMSPSMLGRAFVRKFGRFLGWKCFEAVRVFNGR